MNEPPTLLLLPGMDGTGRLFRRFTSALGPTANPIVVSYPADQPLTLDNLADLASDRAPAGRYAIVAESFSGPVAILLAARRPPGLLGVVLSTSFVAPLAPRWLCAFPFDLLFRFRPPAWLLRHLLLEPSAETALVSEVAAAIQAVSPRILSARLRQVLRVDVRDALQRCSVPILFLAGASDRLLGTRGARAAGRARPSIETLTLDGPHLLLQTKPHEAATVIAAHASRWFAS